MTPVVFYMVFNTKTRLFLTDDVLSSVVGEYCEFHGFADKWKDKRSAEGNCMFDSGDIVVKATVSRQEDTSTFDTYIEVPE